MKLLNPILEEATFQIERKSKKKRFEIERYRVYHLRFYLFLWEEISEGCYHYCLLNFGQYFYEAKPNPTIGKKEKVINKHIHKLPQNVYLELFDYLIKIWKLCFRVFYLLFSVFFFIIISIINYTNWKMINIYTLYSQGLRYILKDVFGNFWIYLTCLLNSAI